LYDLMV